MKRAFLLAFALMFIAAGGTRAGYITPDLDAQLEKMTPAETITVIVMLEDRVDIRALKSELYEMHTTRAERHEIAVTTLMQKAEETQGDLLAFLEEGKTAEEVIDYHNLWISNIVIVEATKDFVEQLANRVDVSDIYLDYEIERVKPVSVSDAQGAIASIEEGLQRIKAPEIWAMGYTGAGRLVCNLDTGVHGSHAALTDRWRGNTEPWEECWYDPVTGTDYPFDAGSHGTHTMGTICGYQENTDDHIGVAYEAEWIAAGVIDRVDIPTTIADALTAFEWAADPDGDPGTTDDVPDVCSNSWGISPIYHGSYLPDGPCDQMFWEVLDGCEAAGCVVVFAAGNEGTSTNAVRNPANRAVDPYNTFSIGAIDGSDYGNDPIAYFSSRGPVPAECGDYTTKPEVVAPGVDVRSSVPSGYSTMSGTSMACPHAAGAVAVLRQVNPNATGDEIKAALMESAMDLGAEGEENTYGWGLIDLEQAFYILGPDEIRGIVRNQTTGHVMDSVLVEVLEPYKFDYTDQYGSYSMKSDFPESVQVAATFVGYEAPTEWIEVVQEGITYHNIWMTAVNPGTLAGYVTDIDTGEGIGGTLAVYSGHLELTHTDIDGGTGYYELEVPEGTWTATVEPENPYLPVSEPGVEIVYGETTSLDFQLAALTEFVDVTGSSGIAEGGFGQGVSFADYDGDGDEDIFVVNLFSDNRLYENDGSGLFTDVAAAAGLSGEGRGFAGVWGDYDRDNDLDVYVTQRNGVDALFENDGGVFTDVTVAAGVGGEGWEYSQGAAWLDGDNDGRLDLYVANKIGANRLYRNLGGGVFEEAGEAWGVADASAGIGVATADYDGDGDTDIYVVNSADGNVLFRNDGGVYTDVSASAGVDHEGSGRGACWADIDGDADMDLFVTNVGADVLFRNDGGVFTDVTASAGVGHTGSGNGCVFVDYDRDGDSDLVVSTGTAMLLYLNDGAGTFLEVSDQVGLSGGLGVGVASGDIEGDGDEDLYIARSNYLGDLLFANMGNSNTWLNVSLRGFASDRNGIGSRLTAYAGTRVYVRDVSAGTGLYSQNSLETEFGLFREASVDSLIVQWPRGKRTKLTGIAAEQSIVVSEGGFVAVPVNMQ